MKFTTEDKFSIVLTCLGMIGAGAVSIFPTQQAYTGWFLIAVAMIGLALIYFDKRFLSTMNVREKSKMINLVGIIVSFIMFLSFLYGYLFDDNDLSRKVGPLLWYHPPGIQMTSDELQRLTIFCVIVSVKNVSDEPQKIDSVQAWSNLTGESYDMGVMNGNDVIPLQNAGRLLPQSKFDLIMKLGETFGNNKGPLAIDFINKWSKIRIVAKFGEFEYKQNFDFEPVIRNAMSLQGKIPK